MPGRTASRWRRRIGSIEPETSAIVASTSVGTTAAGGSGTTRTDARIESTSRSSRSICSSVASCQAARWRAANRVARLAALERRIVGEEVRVGADDGQRRPELVGDERDQLAPGLVDRAERSTRASASACWRPFSTIPASRSAIAPSCATSPGVKSRGRSVWTLSTPTTWSFHDERHGQHRGDEPALVDAPDPQEARVGADVGDHQRLALAATRPVTPSPNGTRARPIWYDRGRSSPPASGTLRRGRGDRARRRRRGARRGCRRRRSRAARPRSAPWSRGARPRAGSGAARADPPSADRQASRWFDVSAVAATSITIQAYGRNRGRKVASACARAAVTVPPRRRSRHRRSRRRAASRDPNVAVRAEPASHRHRASARDPLAREVDLLGALLGQVIAEQAGRDALRPRRAGPAARRSRSRRDERAGGRTRAARGRARRLDLDATRRSSIRAFSLYFQLVNLAEERQRVRTAAPARARGRPRRARSDDSIARARSGAFRRDGRDDGGRSTRSSTGCAITPVLTAHPTEARRRTLLLALRRVDRLLERLDDPRPDAATRTATSGAGCARRSRSCGGPPTCARSRPSAARRGPDRARVLRRDAVRRVVPRLLSGDRRGARRGGPAGDASGEAADAGRTGTRPPLVPAFLRWGSWIGGDRDGNPASPPRRPSRRSRIHADHVLRGYEAVAVRLMQTIAASASPDARRPAARHAARPRRRGAPGARSPAAPPVPRRAYRQRLGAIAERLRRTRADLTGDAGAADRPLRDRRRRSMRSSPSSRTALVADGLERVAWGEVQDLRWQLADVRVPPRVARGPPAQRRPRARRSRRSRRDGTADDGGRAGRHRERGARRRSGRSRALQARLRRGGEPALRHQLHARRPADVRPVLELGPALAGLRRRSTPATARRRAAVRVRRRARRPRRRSSTSCSPIPRYRGHLARAATARR